MIALQILSVLFGAFMLYVAKIHQKKGYINPLEAKFWTVIWIVFIIAAIFPESMQGIVQTLQIARVFDFFVILAFMILSYISYSTRVLVSRFERKLEQAVRREAVREAAQS